jgi:hypothetical protein
MTYLTVAENTQHKLGRLHIYTNEPLSMIEYAIVLYDFFPRVSATVTILYKDLFLLLGYGIIYI